MWGLAAEALAIGGGGRGAGGKGANRRFQVMFRKFGSRRRVQAGSDGACSSFLKHSADISGEADTTVYACRLEALARRSRSAEAGARRFVVGLDDPLSDVLSALYRLPKKSQPRTGQTSVPPSMVCVWYVLSGCSGTEKNTLIKVVFWECSLVFLVRGMGRRQNPLR